MHTAHRRSNSERNGLLSRWAGVVTRRRGLVVGIWVVALIGLLALSRAAGGSFSSNLDIPGTESQKAADLLKSRFPQQAGDSATIVFKDARGLNDPAVQGVVATVLHEAAGLKGVVGVGSPYQQNGAGGISQDGTIGYASVQYAKRASSLTAPDVKPLLNLVDRAKGGGLTVEAGGAVVYQTDVAPPGASEAIGVLFAVFILLLAFGSVVAMGLPLATAIVALGVSFAGIAFLANVLEFPSFASEFAALIGLGVGIDYALLVVTRYREGLHAGKSVAESVELALTTAGRSVIFAGSVVVIALLGLTLVGIPFVGALGVGSSLVVAVAVLVALTLLPALLAFSGRGIDRWSVPFLHVELGGSQQTGGWYRLARRIQRRPLLWFGASLALLLALALPVLRLQLGSSDAGNGPTSLHSRRAYDLLSDGFGAGFNGPLAIVVDTKGAGAKGGAALATLGRVLSAQPGVAQVSAPLQNAAGDAAIIQVTPSTSPQDTATQDLIHTLRHGTLPPALAGTGVRAYVAGPTAAFIDIGDRIQSRLPLFFTAVIGLSVLVLTAVFRSAVVALKAGVMNLISIGAAYGVLVAVFQWGWFSNVVGVRKGPVESFLPMFLFAILFGLSMDYEVFLISRVREAYLATGDNKSAVAHGLAVTARVITAAAAIMVVVFLSFALGDARVVKEFGVGLATAVFVDATIVRLVLVPSTMELLGNGNWWLPAWLDRMLPHLDVEGKAGHGAGLPGTPLLQPVPVRRDD
ncbi:MAG TPA: MMPL family transporter [Dehalococcoidia bacterium]|nr:MMPL family transporter [Dehalococcoidia bacterium]